MSALSVYDLNSLEAAETTWHIPVVLGALAGGVAMHVWMNYNERARKGGGEMSGLSGYRRGRSRSAVRNRFCVRWKNTRGGKRCAKYRAKR